MNENNFAKIREYAKDLLEVNPRYFYHIIKALALKEERNQRIDNMYDYGYTFNYYEHILIEFKKNHVFELCNGVILGNYSIDNNYFKDIFKKYVNKPMIKCEDFGHSTYNLVLPIGAKVIFDADSEKIEIIDEIFN